MQYEDEDEYKGVWKRKNGKRVIEKEEETRLRSGRKVEAEEKSSNVKEEL